MSQTEISTPPDSGASRQGDSPIDQVSASELAEPIHNKQRYRVLSLVAAGTGLLLSSGHAALAA